MAKPQYISSEMLALNRALHEQDAGFGGSGWKHAQEVVAYAHRLHARDILDYGCGEGSLKASLRDPEFPRAIFDGRIEEYDPAVPGKEKARAADLLVCTDVLEHVEPKMIDNVLTHIRELGRRGAYLAIALRPSNKLLADGRNAHLIVKSATWWLRRMKQARLRVVRHDVRRTSEDKPHSLIAWVLK